ncbi:hypothetical protein QQG55_23430 [Brugia pahangi]
MFECGREGWLFSITYMYRIYVEENGKDLFKLTVRNLVTKQWELLETIDVMSWESCLTTLLQPSNRQKKALENYEVIRRLLNEKDGDHSMTNQKCKRLQTSAESR